MEENLGQSPFGEFKGKNIEDIATSCLEWVKGEDWFKKRFADLHENILKELKYRERFGGPDQI